MTDQHLPTPVHGIDGGTVQIFEIKGRNIIEDRGHVQDLRNVGDMRGQDLERGRLVIAVSQSL